LKDRAGSIAHVAVVLFFNFVGINMTISTEQFARMTAIANELGDFFAQEPNCEAVLLQLDEIRRNLVDECDPVGSPGLWNQLETIDRLLDIIEARRNEVICCVAMNLRSLLLTGDSRDGR
jgi:hypothetical protein